MRCPFPSRIRSSMFLTTRARSKKSSVSTCGGTIVSDKTDFARHRRIEDWNRSSRINEEKEISDSDGDEDLVQIIDVFNRIRFTVASDRVIVTWASDPDFIAIKRKRGKIRCARNPACDENRWHHRWIWEKKEIQGFNLLLDLPKEFLDKKCFWIRLLFSSVTKIPIG